MKHIVSKLISVLIVLSFASIANAASTSKILTHTGIESSLFSQTSHDFNRYNLIIGKMIYQEEDDPLYSKGYRPKAIKNIEGEIQREVYDYPKTISALALYRQLASTFQTHHYTNLFNCKQGDCGEVAAWQLYLGREVAGNIQTQYYMAYSKTIDDHSNYIVVYINEIDHQARLVIERISTKLADFSLHVYFDQTEIIYPRVKGRLITGSEMYFNSNAIKPTQGRNKAIETFMAEANANPTRRYAIVGYADDQGSSDYNLSLSQKRAEYMRQLLITHSKIDEVRLQAYGMGESQPLASNELEAGRQKNRRIEFYHLDN